MREEGEVREREGMRGEREGEWKERDRGGGKGGTGEEGREGEGREPLLLLYT